MRSQTIIILVGGILIGLFLGYEIFNAGSITKKAGKNLSEEQLIRIFTSVFKSSKQVQEWLCHFYIMLNEVESS